MKLDSPNLYPRSFVFIGGRKNSGNLPKNSWLKSLTPEQVRAFDQTETLAPMERRIYRWHCGCNQQRMMEVLAPTMRQDPEGLFGDEEKIEIRCPRCGARHAITREAMEAFVAS